MSLSLLSGSFQLSHLSKCQHKHATHVFDVHQQDIVCLMLSNEVENLLCAIGYHNDITTCIQVFEVFQGATNRATFKAVQAILGHPRNVTMLVLHLSFRCFHIFPKVYVFCHLVTLDINIPHATLVPFLLCHPHMEDLTLGPCGNSWGCPLLICPLPCLQTVTCPPSCCMHALASGSPVMLLAATYNSIEHTPFPIFKVSILTNLHLDFDAMSIKLLCHVSVVAPALQNLKLTESKCSQEVHPDDADPRLSPDVYVPGCPNAMGRWFAVSQIPPVLFALVLVILQRRK